MRDFIVFLRINYSPPSDLISNVLLRCWDSTLSVESQRRCLSAWCNLRIKSSEHGPHFDCMLRYVSNVTSLKRIVDRLISALDDPNVPDGSYHETRIVALFQDIAAGVQLCQALRAEAEDRIRDLTMTTSYMISKLLCSDPDDTMMVAVHALIGCIKWVK